MSLFSNWWDCFKCLNWETFARALIYFMFMMAAMVIGVLLAAFAIITIATYTIDIRPTQKYTTTKPPTTPTPRLRPMPLKDAIAHCRDKEGGKKVAEPMGRRAEADVRRKASMGKTKRCKTIWLGFRADPTTRYRSLPLTSRDRHFLDWGSMKHEEKNPSHPDKPLGYPYEGATMYYLSNEDGTLKQARGTGRWRNTNTKKHDQPILYMTKRKGDICDTDAYQCGLYREDGKNDNIEKRFNEDTTDMRGRKMVYMFDNHKPDKIVHQYDIENSTEFRRAIAIAISIRHKYNFISTNRFAQFKPSHWQIQDGEHDCVAMELRTGLIKTRDCDSTIACPYCE